MVVCPICGSFNCSVTLQEYSVLVKKNAEQEVGGLTALECESGHIFFVRTSDLSFAVPPRRLPEGEKKQPRGKRSSGAA